MISEIQLFGCFLAAVLCVYVVFPLIYYIYISIENKILRWKLKKAKAKIETLNQQLQITRFIPNNMPIYRKGMQFVSYCDKDGNLTNLDGTPIIKH